MDRLVIRFILEWQRNTLAVFEGVPLGASLSRSDPPAGGSQSRQGAFERGPPADQSPHGQPPHRLLPESILHAETHRRGLSGRNNLDEMMDLGDRDIVV